MTLFMSKLMSGIMELLIVGLTLAKRPQQIFLERELELFLLF